jgi:hypothetical protein
MAGRTHPPGEYYTEVTSQSRLAGWTNTFGVREGVQGRRKDNMACVDGVCVIDLSATCEVRIGDERANCRTTAVGPHGDKQNYSSTSRLGSASFSGGEHAKPGPDRLYAAAARQGERAEAGNPCS